LPTPEDLAREREIDEALFSDDVAVSQQPDQRGSLDFAFTRDTEAEHHDIAVDDLDAALFGTAPANGSVPDAGTPEATAPHFDGADPEFLLGHSDEADEDVKDDELVEGDATIVAGTVRPHTEKRRLPTPRRRRDDRDLLSGSAIQPGEEVIATE